MNKVFQKIDALPIVRILQVAAILVIIAFLLQFVGYFAQAMRGPYGTNSEGILNAVMLTGMSFGRALFEPLMLLAIAHIIKILSEKNDQN